MISADSSLDPADVERDSISHTKTMTTESSEDYLEAIFVIRAERGSCRVLQAVAPRRWSR